MAEQQQQQRPRVIGVQSQPAEALLSKQWDEDDEDEMVGGGGQQRQQQRGYGGQGAVTVRLAVPGAYVGPGQGASDAYTSKAGGVPVSHVGGDTSDVMVVG